MNDEEYRQLYHEYVFGVGVSSKHPTEEGYQEWLQLRKEIDRKINKDSS